jgi:hypothetical protein
MLFKYKNINLSKGAKVYVCFDPLISPSFVEKLTIQNKSECLLFFEEKTPYYAVEYREFLFYAYSYNTAGNILIVEKVWHLPFAKFVERCRRLGSFLHKKENKTHFNKVLNKKMLP